MAYDGMNNTFNLTYEILAWKIHKALVKAKLEPYLGFLHSNQMAKLSLVCDFQELYRYLIDDFLINYSQKISKKDFKMKRVCKSWQEGETGIPNRLRNEDLAK